MSNAGHATGGSRRVARNALWRSAGEVIGKLASLALFVVMARELGRDGFGDFTFALSLTTVLLLASGFGMEDLLAREVSREHARVHDYLSNVATLKAVASVGLLGLALLIAATSVDSSEAVLAVLFVGIGVAIENLGRTWHSVFQAYEQLRLISISIVIQRVLTALVGIAVLLSGGGLVAVSIIFMAGALTGFAVAVLVLRRFVVRPRWRVDRARWPALIKAGVPIGVAALLFTLVLRLDITLLGVLSGADGNEEVGVYGAAFRLVEATMFLSWAFGAAALPWLARRSDDRAVARGYALGLKAITAILMPIGLTFVLLAEPLVDLMYGPEYAASVLPLRLLGVMTIAYGANSLASTLLISRDCPGVFTRVVAVVVVVNIALNLALIPSYGADGVAFAAAFSALLMLALTISAVASVTAPISLARAFLSPLLGGAAMAVVILATNLPLIFAGALGLAVYVSAVLTIEALAFSEDFAVLRRVVARRAPAAPA
ncbi:MAG TPA: oligosaccharide flippase family protein [Solirubrobacteraceae bacterium]|nr:oligosaccharide flippase family protein [Solirubrobacteraceae bacterium]